MTAREAIAAMSRGDMVRSMLQEYPEVRLALQEQAAQWIDQRRDRLAARAFDEMYRLDVLFGYRANTESAE